MLITASFTFLLLTTPSVVLDFLRSTQSDENFRVVGPPAVVEVMSSLAIYLNHSISFYIYLLSGTRFRQEVSRFDHG